MPKIRFRDETEKRRVVEIAVKMVESRAAKGEVDVDDDDALRAAMAQAIGDATAAYRAAVEYIS